MKRPLLKIPKLIAILLLLAMLPFPLYPQTFANQKNVKRIEYRRAPSSHKLRDLIVELKNKYRVNILFEEKLLNDFVVNDSVVDLTKGIEQNLEALLSPVNLAYQKVKKNAYLIVPKVKEAAQPGETTTVPMGEDAGTITTAPSESEAAVKVSGIVKDETGAALPGVSIVEKGTANGTTSDATGSFVLSVQDEKSVLVFSFIGYGPHEEVVGTTTNLSITLTPDVNSLQEIVVLGYGSQKKEAISGSVVTLAPKELVETSVGNLSNAIAGRLPGVIVNSTGGEPGADDAQILIRGKATLGNTSALIVIDGIPDRGGFSRLNPQDIESFTVLKDASAAIYGARAANGVILITTKRGTTGKPVFSATSSVTFSQLATNPQKYQLDSWQQAKMGKEAIDNLGNGGSSQYTDEQIELMRNGTQPLVYANTDWYDVMLKEWSTQTNNSISVKGGSQDIRYYVSGQLMRQDGIYKGGDFPYKQASIRANLDVKLTKTLSLGLDLLNRTERRNFSQSGANNGQFLNESRTLIAYFPNGLVGKGIQPGQFNFAEQNSPRGGYSNTRDNIINSKITMTWDLPVKGLSLAGYGAFDTWNQSYKQFKNTWDEYIYDYTTDQYIKAVDNTQRSMTQKKTNNATTTYNFKLNYAGTFDEHSIEAFVAYEQSRNENDYISASRQGFASPLVDDLFAGATNTGFNNDGSSTAFGRKNLFGRINYDYSDKYFATFSLRRDGSQNFPKDKRYGTFPALSVGWALSNEDFLSSVESVDFLKLRASWGKMGNDNIAPFQYLSSYQFTNYDSYCCGVLAGYDYGNGTLPGIYESVVANPSITWETATTTNIGLESVLLEDLVTFEFDYFTSKREGILIQRNASVPEYTGLVLPDENLGVVKSSGYEIQLGVHKQLTPDLSLSVNTNMSYAHNKVEFYDEPVSIEPWQKYEGRPIDSFLLWESVGIYQNQEQIDASVHGTGIGPGSLQLKDQNDDGLINDKDRIRINNGKLPNVMYGINIGFTYKHFDFSFLLQGQAGGNVLAYDWDFNRNIFENRWQKEGDSKYPRVETGAGQGAQNPNSTFWLKSTDFLRFKNVNLAYNMPHKILEPLRLSSLQVYVRGNNLFLLYDKMDGNYRDPETGVADYLTLPLQRTVQVGLNLSF